MNCAVTALPHAIYGRCWTARPDELLEDLLRRRVEV